MVEKQVAGDWYDIRTAYDDPFKLEEYFALSDDDVARLQETIRLSVEEGVVEAKRKMVNPVFAFVDSQRYDSRNFDEITRHVAAMRWAIYVTLLQRLLVLGTMKPRKQQTESKLGESAIATDVNTIIDDVRERIAKDTELRKNPSVKNILMQVSYYKRELENFKQLASNIPKEKAAGLQANFRRSFESISQKIRDNYTALLAEFEKESRKDIPTNIFERFDFRPLAPFFVSEAKDFAQVASVLMYAEKERYKTREILSVVPSLRDRVVGHVDREMREYERVTVGHGKQAARELAWEIIRIFDRQRNRSAPEEMV